jgi:hypothetical protein
MKINLIASRLARDISGCDYTVMIRSSGAGNVDVSLWLNDQEALQLASELRAAVAKGSAAADAPAELTTTPEAA